MLLRDAWAAPDARLMVLLEVFLKAVLVVVLEAC